MKADLATGYGQADLSLKYDHRGSRGFLSGFKLKDFQVMLAEFYGTFFLAFFISTTAIVLDSGTAAYAIGFGLSAIIYALGPISGGMVNPAVTISIFVRSKLSLYETVYCIVSQVAGACFAGIIAYCLYSENWDNTGYPRVNDTSMRPQAFVGEFVQTFALCTVALCTATTKAQANNSYFGCAIGFVILSGALLLGGVSGGSFNPAIAFLAVLHSQYDDLWVIMLAPFLGGITAGLVFRLTNPSEWDDSDPFARLTKTHHNPDGNITRTVSMLLQEFLGTFYLTWGVALSINVTQTTGAIAFSFLLASWAYAGGAISGAHYNPCISWAVYLRSYGDKNHMRLVDLGMYWGCQVLGAFSAGLAASYVNHGFDRIAAPTINYDDHSAVQAFFAEFIFSCGLAVTALTTGTTENAAGNSYFGLVYYSTA